MSADPTPPTRPLLRVVSGEPAPEELAALVAVLTARGTAPAGEPEPVTTWAVVATSPHVT